MSLKAFTVMHRTTDEAAVVFAESPGKAKYLAHQTVDQWDSYDDDWVTEFTSRRNPDADRFRDEGRGAYVLKWGNLEERRIYRELGWQLLTDDEGMACVECGLYSCGLDDCQTCWQCDQCKECGCSEDCPVRKGEKPA